MFFLSTPPSGVGGNFKKKPSIKNPHKKFIINNLQIKNNNTNLFRFKIQYNLFEINACFI